MTKTNDTDLYYLSFFSVGIWILTQFSDRPPWVETTVRVILQVSKLTNKEVKALVKSHAAPMM